MRALALSAVRQFQIIDVPKPPVGSTDVLIRIAAVGLCGTDLHIYSGDANYHLSPSREPISLSQAPQILGHEIAGRVEQVGAEVQRVGRGDLVVVDQVLSCRSLEANLCEYCETDDSHQCLVAQEYGITGLSGGFAEFMVVPEVNLVKVPDNMTALESAVVEPLGCIIHAQRRVDAANTRYGWDGNRRVRHVAILGAGPSGLLFLQYLRNVIGFGGEILIFDQREAKLNLARRFGAVAIDVRDSDIPDIIERQTLGEGFQYVIEATGNGQALQLIPKLVRKQATLLLYGAGHANLQAGCLTPWQSMELSVVCSAGASGAVRDHDGPEVYSRAVSAIAQRKIEVAPLVTHRYATLESLPEAFANDWQREEFIKAVFLPQE